ncbi:bZIP family transcription factor [Phlyctema vagabunda]|uniref:BZIP family transcription factor n=1 Tax=Phlyctema vagabunda TaxID=108571 RepID=A0ABR4PC12_9HELO
MDQNAYHYHNIHNHNHNHIPKDTGYALNLLSEAAMHAPDPNAIDHSSPSRTNTLPRIAHPDEASSITNRHRHHDFSSHQHHLEEQQHRRHPVSMPERTLNVTPSASTSVSSTEYPAALSSQGSMDSLSYTTVPAHRPHVYLQHGYQGMEGTDLPNHLGILSAERYDDGRSAQRAHEASELRRKQQAETMMPFGITSGPALTATSEENEPKSSSQRKKRVRADISGTAPDEEDWASKKSRGRPRVDTKDETAADRRRTQIRMAQRAYRHRKETTISSLEKQVQELKGASEEMSNTFIGLYDFAIDRGLLQREPEFGRQLQSTIERIIALAKASSADDGIKDEDQLVDDTPTAEPDEPEAPPPPRRTRARKPSQAAVHESLPSTTSSRQQAWGGYEVSREESPAGTAEAVNSNVSTQRDYNTAADFTYQEQTFEQRTRSDDYQVVSRATEDNASFPFNMNVDLEQYQVEVPPVRDFAQNIFSHVSLSLPNTYSFQELSFGRRLQRFALENACKLANAKEPNENHYRRIFGFCLLYETKDAIKARIEKCISSTTKQTLQEWRQPFLHVGGSGTHYPIYETNNHLMPKFRTGFSMGPQSPAVISAREQIMGDDFNCKLSGFEGEFFDSNDVEGYLRGRGVEIPPAADFVHAEINLLALSDAPSLNSSSSDTTNPSPKTPVTPANRIEELLDHSIEINHYDIDFAESNMVQSKPVSGSMSHPTLNTSDWSDLPNHFNADPMLETVDTGDEKQGKVAVTLDVNILMREITSHGVCLGRGPGFRSADINAAIIAAAKAGAGLK